MSKRKVPDQLPPHAVSIGQFTDIAGRLRRGVDHGDSAVLPGRRLWAMYERLDPLDTLHAEPDRAEILLAGLGHAAVVSEVAQREAKKAGAVGARKLGEHVSTDLAVAALATANSDHYLFARHVLDRREERILRERGGDRITQASLALETDLLSVRTTRINFGRAELRGLPSGSPERQIRGTILRAETAAVLDETATLLSRVGRGYENAVKAGKTGFANALGGSGVELMFFGYGLAMDLAKPNSDTPLPRLALTREDSPDIQGWRPRRNFDLVTSYGSPVQIKSGTAAAGGYDESIAVVRMPKTNLAEDIPLVAGWLSTLTDRNATVKDVGSAMSQLQTYFEPGREAMAA